MNIFFELNTHRSYVLWMDKNLINLIEKIHTHTQNKESGYINSLKIQQRYSTKKHQFRIKNRMKRV